MRLALQSFALLIVLTFSSLGYIQQPATDEQTAAAIKQLWSADETERQQGKDKLRQVGQKAVPGLISLLKELWQNPVPRYATGKEDEGAAAMEQARKAAEKHDSKEIWNIVAKLQGTDIRARLIEDAAGLLGRLKAVEAIPLFIDRLLMDDNSSGTHFNWTPSMNALAEMGSAAVPSLIEAIETAKERAAFVPDNSGVQPSKQGIKWDTELIQTRAAMVLGKIGDTHALPVLTGLKCEDPVMRHYVDEAIKSIFEKAK
jgi:HEAT repeat protein